MCFLPSCLVISSFPSFARTLVRPLARSCARACNPGFMSLRLLQGGLDSSVVPAHLVPCSSQPHTLVLFCPPCLHLPILLACARSHQPGPYSNRVDARRILLLLNTLMPSASRIENWQQSESDQQKCKEAETRSKSFLSSVALLFSNPHERMR